MYEIAQNGQVFVIDEQQTQTQTAIIKRHLGMLRCITAETPMNLIVPGEVLPITLKWKIFDPNNGAYIDDPSNNADFLVWIAGLISPVAAEDGQAVIKFDSAEVGSYIIKTMNAGVDNVSVVVEVQ